MLLGGGGGVYILKVLVKRKQQRRRAAAMAALAMLVAIFLLPSSVPQSEAIRPALPQFREAPAFRNGDECRKQPAPAAELGARGCDQRAVHVAMTLDAAYLRGSMAAVLSIVQHASCPEDIVFHFLVSDQAAALRSAVDSAFPYLRFKLYRFDETLVHHRISSSVRSDLEQPLNYARNYIAAMVPRCVSRVIYLDSDLVLVDDIAKLWNTELTGGAALGAPEYCHANLTKYFTPRFWANQTLASTLGDRRRPPCYFNTGVMVMDLGLWRRREYTKQLERWMEVQKQEKIYELGSLPPFLLVFGGEIQPIEHRWNQHGLGGDYVLGSCRPLHPGPVSLLHWSGKGKPWARLDSGQACPLDLLWAPYDLLRRRRGSTSA